MLKVERSLSFGRLQCCNGCDCSCLTHVIALVRLVFTKMHCVCVSQRLQLRLPYLQGKVVE